MKKSSAALFLFILMSVILTGCGDKNKTYYFDQDGNMTTKKPAEAKEDSDAKETPADKLEVYYFHATARCYSCRTIGQYVKETMEGKYAEQLKNGKIDYREINVDLPENKDIALKYQASGSSLFINRIIGGEDNIESDTNVWRLLSDEAGFKSYLEKKINSYLGI